MIVTYKELPPEFQSVREFKLYSSWELNETNIGTGSNNIQAMDAFYTASMTSTKEHIEDSFDSDNYLLTYNYKLYGGDYYMPISESLNPNGTSKRMVWYSINRLFYNNRAIYQDQFTTASLSDTAYVFSIPQKKFGESIERGTFSLTDISDTVNQPYSSSDLDGIIIQDDSHGNLYDTNNQSSSSLCIGNISYNTGLVIITDSEYRNYFVANSGSADIDIVYDSYITAYEHEYICVVKQGEFNSTLNPSFYDDGGGDPDGIKRPLYLKEILGDNFHVFVTTIGLYDDTGQMVARAKLANPVRMEKNFDSVFIVKFDI